MADVKNSGARAPCRVLPFPTRELSDEAVERILDACKFAAFAERTKWAVFFDMLRLV